MELKDFISETLSQLIEGVIDAQNKVLRPGDTGGRVCPHVRNLPTEKASAGLYGRTNDNLPVILVDFDILLVAQEESGKKGGIGVVTGLVGLGAQRENRENSQTSHKIQFKIPVALPLQTYIENKTS
jgi:hypothetical protein